jgi:hypothetical protein
MVRAIFISLLYILGMADISFAASRNETEAQVCIGCNYMKYNQTSKIEQAPHQNAMAIAAAIQANPSAVQKNRVQGNRKVAQTMGQPAIRKLRPSMKSAAYSRSLKGR